MIYAHALDPIERRVIAERWREFFGTSPLDRGPLECALLPARCEPRDGWHLATLYCWSMRAMSDVDGVPLSDFGETLSLSRVPCGAGLRERSCSAANGVAQECTAPWLP